MNTVAHRARASIALIALALGGVTLSTLGAGCGRREDPELARGVQAITWMVAPVNVGRSFYFRNHSLDTPPSAYVDWLFSPEGSGDWPDVEGSIVAAASEEMRRSTPWGPPLLPAGVAFQRSWPDPRGGRQIVLRADDKERVIVVEAFLPPAKRPVISKALPWAPARRAGP